jgi:hypothetical protein
MTTLQQYLKVSELKELHRVSSIAWDKFARNIRIELAKAPGERMDAAHFLKINRKDFDHLMETSPMIDMCIIQDFKKTFQGEDGSKERQNYENLRKPDICDTIISVSENRHHWYLEQRQNSPKLDSTNLDIKNRQDIDADISQKQNELQEILKTIKTNEIQIYEFKIGKIKDYMKTFLEVYGRQPLKEELMEQMKKDNIEESFLTQFLEKNKTSLDGDINEYVSTYMVS